MIFSKFPVAVAGLLVTLAAGCAETGYERSAGASATTVIDGRTYSVTVIRNEPYGHVIGAPVAIGLDGRHIEAEPPSLDAGPYQPAIRISGAASGDLQSALRAFAEVCGFDYDAVKDWGAYGDPIWQDPRDGDVVLWTDACPGLSP